MVLRIQSWRRAAPSLGSRKTSTIIENLAELPGEVLSGEPAEAAAVPAVAVKAPPKKRAKVVKVYAPHEHFGSPLNVCRICGEKYSYVQKPHGFGIGNQ